MPLIHVPTMIDALSKIKGVIVSGQLNPRHVSAQFEQSSLWVPALSNRENESQIDAHNGRDPLEDVLVSSLDEDQLGDAIKNSSKIRSPWGTIGEDGTDALAWYVSFHRDPQNWGIYVPISGLLRFADHISPFGPGPSGWAGLVKLALRGLLAHERIHYAVDYAAGQIELLFNAPCYILSRTVLSNGMYVPDEEQLANGASLRSIRWRPIGLDVPEVYKATVDFTLAQPAGYRDGIKCVDTPSFLNFANEFIKDVSAQLLIAAKPPIAHSIDYTKFLPLGPLLDFRGRASKMAAVDGSQCPVYLIHDETTLGIPSGSIAFINQIPAILHSSRFDRDLKKIGMYKEWEEVKSILSDPSKPRGRINFKPWPPDDRPGIKGWSTNVGKGNTNIRAHIHQILQTNEWVAERIANADRLKHH